MSPAEIFSIKLILILCILENKLFLISSLISNDGLAIKRSCPYWAVFCIKKIINVRIIIFDTAFKSPDPIAGISCPARNAKMGQQA